MYPNIAAERARIGMTKTELAKKLGVSEKTLYNWERKGGFPLSALITMSDMFCCSVDYLIGRSETRLVN